MNVRRWAFLGLVIVAVGLLAVWTPLIAQDEGGDQGNRGGGQYTRGGGQFDPQAFRQRMMDNIKQRLGADDDQWKTIEPLLDKVMQLNAELQPPRGFRGFGGRGGGQGGANANNSNDTALPDTTVKTQALSGLLDKTDATDEQITQAMEDLRAARRTAESDLAKARKQLHDVLTLKQQAQLLVMGILD
jgi:hypothetical protein